MVLSLVKTKQNFKVIEEQKVKCKNTERKCLNKVHIGQSFVFIASIF